MTVQDIVSPLQYTDFALYYTNDFNYVFEWDANTDYFIGDLVSRLNTTNYKNQIYSALQLSINQDPLTQNTYWALQSTNNKYVLQADIVKAMTLAKEEFPYQLFDVNFPEKVKQMFWLLVAFYVVLNHSKLNSGLTKQATRLVNSRSIASGAVAESFDSGNTKLLKDLYYDNAYGQEYYDNLQILLISRSVYFLSPKDIFNS
jgi:hypothetical protein